jgi:hypothetical protein
MSGHAITQDTLPGNLVVLVLMGFPVASPHWIVRCCTKRLPPLAGLFTLSLPGKGRTLPAAGHAAGRRASHARAPGKIVAEQR